MITSRFPLGDVSFSAEYFSTLVGEATKQCYGVAAMTPRDLTDAVKSVVRGSDYSEKGVRVNSGGIYHQFCLIHMILRMNLIISVLFHIFLYFLI